MSKRRVVVTGLGCVAPNGNDVNTAWDAIVNGRSGIGPITRFDASALPARIGGEIKHFDPSAFLSPKEARKLDLFIHFGLGAAEEALADSGLEITDDNAERIGSVLSSGIGGMPLIEQTTLTIRDKGPRRVSPFFIPGSIINMLSGYHSMMRGLKGPNFSTVSACTTSAHSIGLAGRMIAYGDADVMFAGGSESSVCMPAVSGFCSARALSTRNDDPEGASRPWDLERDGFVFSEGAGAMVLEEYEYAKARGATIYAELTGFGMSGDAHHMTLPSPGGEGASRCMVNALKDAGINADAVDYVNAHGTSTPAGDKIECDALKTALGDHAYKVAVSSTKSMTGHMLGAAGGIEAIFSVLAIRDQIAPPTINLENPDPECDLDFVPNQARDMTIDVALSNSFGFGGTNGTLIFSRLD